ncbi:MULTISPECIES: hypothetical protein [Prochlorococcus]|uniref:hypothetical protein n=1 Tax=Prochlorococcus TaxID=1218 RepID=UPI0007B338C5|nr:MULTISPECIES: hypothetical protein [Prochlorococcus]KZR60762.1 hypothetical protein PMIT1312_02430 [Prochlorococcus marinus str. MIT 1312]KZR79616.1 hypothetical protein PMIT1327_01675 [Prochlorococcus marinus str. MIT 1327]NMO84649.1 hypothetical protein [Prochlorococcus sp. P1344]NMP06675.1 hypothetical protein [Prochlorococcus sp. P1361]NMP13632.1 hypothetical protein [Prochlorococcus sp.P1363]
MTDEETSNSEYWEERSEELSNDELKGVSGGIDSVPFDLKSNNPKDSGSSVKKGLEDLDGQVKEDSGFKTHGGNSF